MQVYNINMVLVYFNMFLSCMHISVHIIMYIFIDNVFFQKYIFYIIIYVCCMHTYIIVYIFIDNIIVFFQRYDTVFAQHCTRIITLNNTMKYVFHFMPQQTN